MTAAKTALVLGATGGIGGGGGAPAARRGWEVRALKRGAGTRRGRPADGITWVRRRRDESRRRDARPRAAASLIVHAVNPPGYRDWGEAGAADARQHALRRPRPSGATHRASRARSTTTGPTPSRCCARTRRSTRRRARARSASRWSGACRLPRHDGARVLDRARRRLLRAARRQQLVLARPGQAGPAGDDGHRPGRRGVGHQWAYLPDVAARWSRCWHAANAWSRSQSSTWPAIGTPTARRWPRRSSARGAPRRPDPPASRLPVVAAAARVALRRHAARAARDALPVAPAGAHGQ